LQSKASWVAVIMEGGNIDGNTRRGRTSKRKEVSDQHL